jgi:hypothetical protein
VKQGNLPKNLPLPLFSKEGNSPSLWKREVRRDFFQRSLPLFAEGIPGGGEERF